MRIRAYEPFGLWAAASVLFLATAVVAAAILQNIQG